MDALRIILILIGAGVIYAIYLYSRTKLDVNAVARQKNRTASVFLLESFGRLKTFFKKITIPSLRTPQELNPHRKHSHYNDLDEASLDTLAGLVASKGVATDVTDSKSDISVDAGVEKDFDPNKLQAINVIDEAEINLQAGEDFLLVLNIKPKTGESFSGTNILQATKAAGMQFGMHDIFHRYTIVHDRVIKTPVCSLANMFEPGTFDFSDPETVEAPGLVMFMQLPGPVDAETAFDNTLRTAQKISLALDARLCDESHSILTTQTIEHLKEKMKAYHFRQRMQATKQHT